MEIVISLPPDSAKCEEVNLVVDQQMSVKDVKDIVSASNLYPMIDEVSKKQLRAYHLNRALKNTVATIRPRIRDLVPNGNKVPKWSQKSPDFASKSQISDSTFRCC